jgi:hypothetical protein
MIIITVLMRERLFQKDTDVRFLCIFNLLCHVILDAMEMGFLCHLKHVVVSQPNVWS